MLVVSAGMQKSGSAYIYNIINDLLVANGGKDARTIKEKYHLEDILKWHNNNVGDLKARHLAKLLRISFRESMYAIKTHSGPTRLLKLLLVAGFVKVIYIYRDPRDVLLSAIDHGKQIAAAGEDHTFARMVDFDTALLNVKSWIRIWEAYSGLPGVCMLRYEDVQAQPQERIKQILKYLGISVNQREIDEILWKYDRKNEKANMRGLHFNKGIAGRFREELSQSEQNAFKEQLGERIISMGYEI